MQQNNKRKWYQLDGRGLSNLLVISSGIILYLALTHLPQVQSTVRGIFNILSPFISGFIIAYLLNTPTTFFEEKVYSKLRHRRSLAIITVFLIALLIIAFLLQLLLPQLMDSLRRLLSNMSYYLMNLNRMAQELISHFDLEGAGIIDLVDTYNTIIRKVTGYLSSSIPELLNFGVAVGNGVVNGITAIISSIYMLSGKSRLIAQVKKLLYAVFPVKNVNHILRVGGNANRIFVGFINGKLVDSAIIGVLCFLLSSILRTPYAILLSVVIGVTNIIPFFGPIIGAAPCLMLLIIVDPWAALRFGVLIIALQQFDGNILGPKILGDSTGLSAIWVLVAIITGGGLFGFPGMVLGVPTFAVLYSLIREWADIRLAEKGIDASGQTLSAPTSAPQPQDRIDTP